MEDRETRRWGEVGYGFNNLSRMRISTPFTRSKILSLVKKAVAPQRMAVASWIASGALIRSADRTSEAFRATSNPIS